MITIADALADLKARGYNAAFRREPDCLYCFELNKCISPDQFDIEETYYFEKISRPDADRVIYAISLKVGLKGTLLDECGVYKDNVSVEMTQKLSLALDTNSQTDRKFKMKLYEYEQLRITHRRFE